MRATASKDPASKPTFDRTNSAGLWHFAHQYRQAGEVIREKNALAVVTYYLFCHSIELALKAYLRGSGHTIQQLINLRHDLEKTLAAAEKLRINQVFPISDDLRFAVQTMNVYYSKKDFEYIFAGYQRLIKLDVLSRVASELVSGLKAYCMQHQHLHDGRPTAHTCG